MLSSFLFLISLFLLLVSFLFIKKTNNKVNIIKWIFISFVLIFCLNSLIVYVLSYIKVAANLLTISFIYVLISVFIYIKFVRKEKQEYFFHKKDLIYLSILFLIVLIISFIRFGFPFSITYKTLDPAVHFQSSYSFYKESFLLNFVQNKTILNFVTWRFGSYTNLGIIFKFVSPFVADNNLYNIYILYDIVTFFMTAVLFFYLINNEKKVIVKLVGTILFLLGYPLNNLLIGFFYVGHASCIIIVTMMIIRELKQERFLFSLLFILNIGLTFTYYLFIPFVFFAQFLYFIKCKHIIRKYLFIFIIPLILGFIYFILPTFSSNDMDLINQTKIDGYFYNDIFGNSLLFFPVIIYYFYYKIKEKKLDFELMIFASLFGFMIVLNICMLCNIILPYYGSKYYYILWIICFTLLFRTYDNYYEKDKFVFKNYAIFMLVTIVLTITNIENKIINLNSDSWNKTTPNMLFNVYNYNLSLINTPFVMFNKEEIEDIKNISEDMTANYITNVEPEQILWLINFFPKEKIDCPVNNTYECIKNLKYKKIDTWLDYCSNNSCDGFRYIYFSRSMLPYNENINREVENNINVLYDDIYEFNTGFILRW